MRINHLNRLLNLILALVFLLSACEQTTPTPGPGPTPLPVTVQAPTQPPATEAPATPEPTAEPTVPAEQPIYLAIVWHQHQPVYFKDPETGIYIRPWVRAHATKDYVDMAAMLKQYPEIHTTFNLTPSLIHQIDDYSAGAKDLYWTIAEVPADQLDDEQKKFLLDRFFDTNQKVIARFLRYEELLQKRDNNADALGVFTTEDYRDLQVLFNLAWVDPDWLAQEPLAGLVRKGRNFSEEDKDILFAEHLRLIEEVIPVHKELQDAGQIEVTMTPFAHPILPLLVTTDLARTAMPDVDLGGVRYVYGNDAVTQVELGVELYEQHFGRPPRGMWPAEGSVAQEIVSMVSKAGIQWMASDEGVLAKSLGLESFTRNSEEVVTEPDLLYRPYYVQGRQGGPVAMVFRDVVISDKVGFTYSGLPGSQAANDFIQRIHAIRDALIESGAEGPHLVSVILDGENAWEHYDNDGKEFLNSLYEGLSSDPLIKTVTPSEFLAIAPEQPAIENLWPGSWIYHDFSTWIGEEEENRAWQYLSTTRAALLEYERGNRPVVPEKLAKAQEYMYIAEGSDWFWWYGTDQNSGIDESFDQQYRNTLKQVYTALGQNPPAFLDVPIIPQQGLTADIAPTGLITTTINGIVDPGEWDAAGIYQASGGVMAAHQPLFERMAYGFDSKSLNLRFDAAQPFSQTNEGLIEVYLSTPGSDMSSNFSRNGSTLGFPANNLVLVEFAGGAVTSAQVIKPVTEETWGEEGTPVTAAAAVQILELAVPLDLLGFPEAGDPISLKAVYSTPIQAGEGTALADADQIPGAGPALLTVPDLGTTVGVLDIEDPENDDFGPGTYTYPQDSVFSAGNYDILSFQVGYDEKNIVFKFVLGGPVDNSWGSPNGLSVQTFDIYIDQDGDGQGGVAMLPGRNLALQEGYAWDYAITAEGWMAGIFTPGEEGPNQVGSPSDFSILVDPGQQRVTIRVPKSLLGEDPAGWRYAAVVLGQEGFPAGGVMRVRDVNPAAEQWRFGGAPSGTTSHTRVIDFVWPNPGDQEAWLSDFTPSSASQGELTEADFARVPMLEIPKE